jgi:hypothetical protein
LLDIWQPLSSHPDLHDVQCKVLECLIKLLETASLFLNTITADAGLNTDMKDRLEAVSQLLHEIELGIEENIGCANIIDCVVNSVAHESLDRPIGHFKMKF